MAGLDRRPRRVGRFVIVKFKLDRRGVQAIAMSGPVRGAVMDVARNRALPYAISISPRSDRTDHRHYQDSFVVVPAFSGLAPEAIGRPPMLRVAARLINISPHAAAVEFGKKGRRGQRILGRTVDHLMSISRRV